MMVALPQILPRENSRWQETRSSRVKDQDSGDRRFENEVQVQGARVSPGGCMTHVAISMLTNPAVMRLATNGRSGIRPPRPSIALKLS